MTRFFLTGMLSLFFSPLFTQVANLSLNDCYEWARTAAPQLSNTATLADMTQLRIDNLDAARLPDLQLAGQLSYQSDVVAFPLEAPGLSLPQLPHERVQLTLDANYTLYDGGRIQARKDQETARLYTEQHAIEVRLYQVRQQVDQAYFGVLLARQQQTTLQTARDELEQRIQQMEAALQYGTITAADLNRLRVRTLELVQQQQEAEHREQAALQSLAALTDTVFAEAPTLNLPGYQPDLRNASPARPELQQFALQRQQIEANEAMLTAQRQPSVQLFLQTGLGYPNPLNFFDDSLSPFAMGGLRARWTITDWQQTSRQRQLLSLQSKMLDRQEQSFRRQISLGEEAYQTELQQLSAQRDNLEDIRRLREDILQESRSRLERGLITATDYLTDLNALLRVEQSLDLVNLQLIREQVQYRTRYGLPLNN